MLDNRPLHKLTWSKAPGVLPVIRLTIFNLITAWCTKVFKLLGKPFNTKAHFKEMVAEELHERIIYDAYIIVVSD